MCQPDEVPAEPNPGLASDTDSFAVGAPGAGGGPSPGTDGEAPPPSGGAIIERLKMFAGAVVAVAVAIALPLAFGTVFGLYKGTRSRVVRPDGAAGRGPGR